MKQALINTTIAPLMKEPSGYSERVDEVLYGMLVDIIDQPVDGWFEINTHYNYKGYVEKSMLCQDENYIQYQMDLDKKVVLHSYADVLGKPSIKSEVLCSITRGGVVSIIDECLNKGWVKISLCGGKEGFIKGTFLGDYKTCACIKEDKLRNQLVCTALLYLGTQYRWGGKTPLGIDCSGLCSMAYMLNGVIIYRDAKIVEGFPVKPIPFSRMKLGDLLYFPGHIAMYLGDDKYVHSTARNGSDGVVINSLNPKDANYREDLAKSLYVVGSIFTSCY